MIEYKVGDVVDASSLNMGTLYPFGKIIATADTFIRVAPCNALGTCENWSLDFDIKGFAAPKISYQQQYKAYKDAVLVIAQGRAKNVLAQLTKLDHQLFTADQVEAIFKLQNFFKNEQ